MTASRFNRSFISSALILAVIFLVAGADADRGSVSIVKIFGKVEISRSGQTAWTSASERLKLRSGDRLRTGDNSWCYLELSEGNIVRITKKSRIVLEAIEQKSEQVEGRVLFSWRGVGSYNVKLEEGNAMPVLEKFSGSSMNFATPVAVAGVRGTVFEATVEHVDGAGVEGADAGGNFNVDFTVHTGLIEVTDLSNPSAAGTFVPAGYSMSFQNVRVPPGGFAGSRGPQGGQAGRAGSPGARAGMEGQAGAAGARVAEARGERGERSGEPGANAGNISSREGSGRMEGGVEGAIGNRISGQAPDAGMSHSTMGSNSTMGPTALRTTPIGPKVGMVQPTAMMMGRARARNFRAAAGIRSIAPTYRPPDARCDASDPNCLNH